MFLRVPRARPSTARSVRPVRRNRDVVEGERNGLRTRHVGFCCLLAMTSIAFAQDYPAKAIRIVTSPPGGSNDFIARLVQKGLAERAGWQIVIDNRPTVLAPEVVMRTAPDGYTLLVSGATFITGNLFEKLPYDPIKDFTSISLTHRQPNILVVHPSLPVKSVKELI